MLLGLWQEFMVSAGREQSVPGVSCWCESLEQSFERRTQERTHSSDFCILNGSKFRLLRSLLLRLAVFFFQNLTRPAQPPTHLTHALPPGEIINVGAGAPRNTRTNSLALCTVFYLAQAFFAL